MKSLKAHLTKTQQEAHSLIMDFFGSDEQCFILKGYAGVGKTFLINVLARELKHQERQFFLIAPTGRAARVLSAKTGFSTATIHSFIYAGADESRLLEEIKEPAPLNFSLKKCNHESDAVYIIDEASMIADSGGAGEFLNFGSGQLLADLFEYIELLPGKRTEKNERKIIFVGDPAQLPPVKQDFSVALSPEYLDDNYDIYSEEFTITEVVRQAADNPILQVATGIRNAITKEDYSFHPFLTARPMEIKPYDFLGNWKRAVDNDSEENVIVIAHTNKTALRYNQMIRSVKYGRDIQDIKVGDRLLVTNNNRFYGLLNGDIVEVVSIDSGIETIDAQGFELIGKSISLSFQDITVAYTDIYGDEIEAQCKIVLTLLNSNAAALTREEYYAMKYIGMQKNTVKAPTKQLKKKNLQKYLEALVKYEEAITNNPYINALQVKFGYAVTCHKAQGGEWKHVFLDFSTFMDLRTLEYFRWAYTAITRAKERLYCLHLPIPSPEQLYYENDQERPF
jgi:ATP-dependent exoDNAse (exonuclease V) alpha subunit